MSVARHHADWLNLVESSGPFVSLPVLMRVFPQGLDPRDPEQARELRLAYEEWQTNPTGPGKQRAWISHVLTRALKFPVELIVEGQGLPPGLAAPMPEYGETLRPDLALVGLKSSDVVGKVQLLISIYRADQKLDRPVTDKHWKATPATRIMELLHAADIPLGLVTNGEQWMLVFAPRGETTGFASWYSTLWIEEQITLRAFHSLLGISRFFGVAAPDTLLALLKESAQDQQEVTNQLGDQVRDAVQVLIQAFDRLDHETGRTLLTSVEEKTLYDAALTVMMRLVFLFSAEERRLLHLGKPIYDDNYAVSTLREQLQETADRYGEEVLERRVDAWSRLLSSFRAIHNGIQHQDLMLPAYGGSLFDPDRYPFLEGRAQGSDWRMIPAEPLAISNRVVLHLLKSLQMLQVRVPGGGPAEARRISFRALDIEQIGHIYEGLLDHSASRARETVLGLVGTKKNPAPNITLEELESLAKQGETKFLEELKELTGRSVPTLKKALSPETSEEHKILTACSQDEKLAKRVVPFGGLLRLDSFDRPVIVLQGGIYVSEGTARRSTGTHYTPRSLTEPIVQHALEPLVYGGPAEGLPKEEWRLKSPSEILGLKVCDMTMGSGAFLVQVCRYLSERLVEAWENLEKMHPGELLVTPEGSFSKGEPSERLVPKEPVERLAIARRLIADRCIYGVDINPMAVEMAKLSIWLVTVDRTRPFTFLDHALKHGDSLLGLSRMKQLEKFNLNDSGATQAIILSNYDQLIRDAIEKRRELEALQSDDAEQIALKEALNAAAEELLSRLRSAADLLIVATLATGNEKEKEIARVTAHLQITEQMRQPLEDFRRFVQANLRRHKPFHWPLEFPEVFAVGGFDALVGNPPFMGGQKITGALGTDYRNYLVETLASEKRGSADLCAYFFLRARSLMRADEAMAGLLATNTIAQGDTREVGLEQLSAQGTLFLRATQSAPWPGGAALEVAHVWLRHGPWRGELILDGKPVSGIGPFLTAPSSVNSKPVRLKANTEKSFQGSIVLGMGFVLTQQEAEGLLSKDSRNSEVIFPFLNGDDINSRPDQSPSRWVINFFDWPLERSAAGSWERADKDQRKEWLRTGSVPSDYPDPVAADYPECLQIVEAKVKPERTRRGDDGEFALRYPLYLKWWIYGEKRPALYRSLRNQTRTLAGVLHTKFWSVAWYPVNIVFSHALTVFSPTTDSDWPLLNSTIHELWAREFSGSLETRLRYSPTDCFETFPFPVDNSQLVEIGRSYSAQRRHLMLERQEGLTQLLNRFHDPLETSADIKDLRAKQTELDQAVSASYGWNDLNLGNGFHETKQGLRYTVSDSARRSVLVRLLSLNHERSEEERRTEPRETDIRSRSNQVRGGRSKSRPRAKDDAMLFPGDSR